MTALSAQALRAALAREGLTLRAGEEEAVLTTARSLVVAARLVREAS